MHDQKRDGAGDHVTETRKQSEDGVHAKAEARACGWRKPGRVISNANCGREKVPSFDFVRAAQIGCPEDGS